MRMQTRDRLAQFRRWREPERDAPNWWGISGVALLALVGAAAWWMYPEIRRYAQMRRM